MIWDRLIECKDKIISILDRDCEEYNEDGMEKFNKEILKVEFCVNDTIKINEILNLVKKVGNTEVKIKIKDQNKNLVFILKNKRLVDRKSINMLKNQDILTTLY